MTKRPFYNENYIQYLEGSLPIIISAPHGGEENPSSIKDRSSGVFDKDDFTKELTLQIQEEFFKQTNNYPHTIIMNLDRKKVDANRCEEEATSEDKNSKAAYRTFHKNIQTAINKVEKVFNKGLYIDIHGQSHSHKAIEFGYLLTNDLLRLDNEKLDKYKELSSIKTLGKFSNYSFSEQIKGEFSLGTLMENQGFSSIPSKQNPYALSDDEYFEGAYNTKTYASTNGSPVSAIQIEFPYYARSSKEAREKTAKAIVSSILEFIKVHFELDLKKVD